MKLFVLLSCIFFSLNSFALSGREAWMHTNMKGKVKLLSEYKEFFKSYQNLEKTSEFKTVKVNFLNLLINEAWADSGMNCIYAGWPSKRVNNSCSSPMRQNPDYQKGSCGDNQLQCQPLFFGKGICVPVSTPQQRSLAFTNCDKKFKEKNISPDALIKEIRSDGNEQALFELMDFADKICKEGKQAGTGMCNRLTATVDKLRHFKNASLEITPQVDKSNERRPAVVSGNTRSITPVTPQTTTPEQQELIRSVTTATTAMKAVYDPDCEPVLTGEPFDRSVPRPLVFEYVTSRQGPDPSYDITYVKDKTSPDLRYTGFEFTNIGPNDVVGDAIDPREKAEREWKFVSTDNSQRETYLWITDDAGSGYLSQLMDTVILLVPRKMKPKIEPIGEDLHVTLTTGEKVIYDKRTKKIKAGSLREGKLDTNRDRFSRKFAPINYTGTGISIRVDKRGEDPRLIPGNATVTQNGKTCSVPARELWNSDAQFRYADDAELVRFLNRKCGNKFSIPL